MFCRLQVAELLPIVPELEKLGARVVGIGNGTVEQAQWFVKELGIRFAILTDPTLKVYQRASFLRGVASTLTPRALLAGIKAAASGHFQGLSVKGDALQQGGVLIVRPSGELAYSFSSDFAGHRPDPDSLLEALRGASA